MITDLPQKVEICPNGLHVGCCCVTADSEYELWNDEELVWPNSEVVCIDVFFNEEIVLMLSGDQAIINKLELFSKAHPTFFRSQLPEQLPLIPPGYKLLKIWEVNQQLQHKMAEMFNYKDIPF
ncbi:MAG: hypothetical protein SWJ54_19410 [Cyanobacteriota bacterium]|nr:hypothetical protein [Cyanobacteriota bacterium]